jgi:hypothetical protein
MMSETINRQLSKRSKSVVLNSQKVGSGCTRGLACHEESIWEENLLSPSLDGCSRGMAFYKDGLPRDGSLHINVIIISLFVVIYLYLFILTTAIYPYFLSLLSCLLTHTFDVAVACWMSMNKNIWLGGDFNSRLGLTPSFDYEYMNIIQI